MTAPEGWRRAAFWAYVPVLFTLTHWPNARIPMPGRPDLLVHLTVFGLWTSLLIGAGFFGAPLSWRNIGVAGAIAAVYSAFDEGTQAIPFIRRQAAWDDWAYNLIGVAAACAGAAALHAAASRRGVQAS